MAEGGSGGSGAAPDTGHTSGGQPTAPNSTGLLPLSPPKSEVDDSPLQKSMDKNKECKYRFAPLSHTFGGYCLLGCDAVQFFTLATFRKNVLPSILLLFNWTTNWFLPGGTGTAVKCKATQTIKDTLHTMNATQKRKAGPVTGRGRRPIGLCDFEDPTVSRHSAHRWRRGCHPYTPAALYP
jgi:hypothetical protein